MKRFALLGVILLLVLTTTIVGADPQTATDLFSGTATTGVGMPMPIDINPAELYFRDDGAIGLGYIYKASGMA